MAAEAQGAGASAGPEHRHSKAYVLPLGVLRHDPEDLGLVLRQVALDVGRQHHALDDQGRAGHGIRPRELVEQLFQGHRVGELVLLDGGPGRGGVRPESLG